MGIYQLKESMAQLGAEIKKEAEFIAANSANPETSMEDIRKAKSRRDELQERYDLLAVQLKAEEAKADKKFKPVDGADGDPTKALEIAKGKYYQAIADKQGVKEAAAEVIKAYRGLGAIPEGDVELGGGEAFLPHNMSNEIVSEPVEDNSLRTIEQITNVTGLEIPIFDMDIDDVDLEDITDKDTATEIKTKGNLISFGRFKTKVKVQVSDTVVHGSPLNLAAHVEQGLRSALAIKEKIRAFDQNPDAEHAGMSFYSTANNIKCVYATTMLDAILAAYGDLADFFAEGARVVMRRTDYIAMIRELVNDSESLFGKKPEEVIGIPVTFNDRAAIPVIGDFRYAHLNYDIGATYDVAKDVDTGMYMYVLTAWGDHKIKLASAFRLAKVGTVPTLNSVTISGTAEVGETLTAVPAYSSGSPSPVLSYQWRYATSASGSYRKIDGATSSTYELTDKDLGRYIKVEVTANGAATGTATSAATAAVAEKTGG